MSELKLKRRVPLISSLLVVPAIGAFLGAFLADELAAKVPSSGKPTISARSRLSPPLGKPAEDWGRLRRRQVSLEPPRNLVFPEVCETTPPVFEFEGFREEGLLESLEALKLRPLILEKMKSLIHCQRGGCELRSSKELLESLTSDERRKFYGFIATLPIADEHSPFMRHRNDPGRWRPRKKVSPRVEKLLSQLSYQDGELIKLSDLSLVCSAAENDEERMEIAATLVRMSALLVEVHVAEGDDPRRIANYWSRGGRAKNLRPLLESLARNPKGGSIDVVHLLPPLARNLLYTYASLDDPTYNCFWSAMNFFADEPDDNFIDAEFTVNRLLRQYERVALDDLELGDVIAFLDSEDNLIHAVAHVADDVVFTKNGLHVLRPWVLMSLSEVQEIYPGTRLQAFRHKRFLGQAKLEEHSAY